MIKYKNYFIIVSQRIIKVFVRKSNLRDFPNKDLVEENP